MLGDVESLSDWVAGMEHEDRTDLVKVGGTSATDTAGLAMGVLPRQASGKA